MAINVAGDNATAIEPAEEFGLVAQGMKIVPMSFQNVDIHAVGLKATRGDLILTSFFEDVFPAARRFSDAFYARRNAMPSQIQAGVYSAVRHYLQAVKDGESDDGATVMAKMKATPVSDAYTPNGRIREDQRMVHDLYLVQVKTPPEIQGALGFVKLVAHHSARPGVPSARSQQVRSGGKIIDRDGSSARMLIDSLPLEEGEPICEKCLRASSPCVEGPNPKQRVN